MTSIRAPTGDGGNPDTAPVPDLTAATWRRSCRTSDHRCSAAYAAFWNPTGCDDPRDRRGPVDHPQHPEGLGRDPGQGIDGQHDLQRPGRDGWRTAAGFGAAG